MTTPRLTLTESDPTTQDVDAVVIGVHAPGPGRDGPPVVAAGGEGVAAAFDGALADTLRLLGATGEAGEVTTLATFGALTAPALAAVGLGPPPPADAETSDPGDGAPGDDPAGGGAVDRETLRRAAGAAVRALSGPRSAALALAAPDPGAVRALAEGVLLGGYRFPGYHRTPPPDRSVRSVTVRVPAARDRATRAALRDAQRAGGAAVRARDWVNTPPNLLRPPEFADQIAAAASDTGLEVEVLDERALRRGGYGGILAVGLGSQAPPRLVRLAYTPPRPPRARIALVGKGITFDSGGVSIKPAHGMWEMKSDMAGAAAVAATALAVAEWAPADVAVTAWVPIAENLPSGTAYRPGDVLTMYGGTKVEVLNTDAEGRLILADAIARACEEEPDYLLETSTLTGGQVVSLGKRVMGVMGSDDLCARVRDAGQEVGEPAWPMPLPDDVRKGMESPVADVSQVHATADRVGTMLQGGIFLSMFVPDGVPWAHLDVAGPAFHTGEPYGYVGKGGTGVPVRTLLRLIETLPGTEPASG